MNRGISKIIFSPLQLPRYAKIVIVSLLDVGLCFFSTWFAFYLRLGEFIILSTDALVPVALSVVLALPVFFSFGLYRAIFRYSGWPALMTVFRAIVIYAILYAAIITAYGVPTIPRTVGIIQPMLLLLFVGGSRALASLWLGNQYQNILKKTRKPKVLIYGAGKSGRQLADAMSNGSEMSVVGFLDDDDRLHGHVLNGLPVYSPLDLYLLVDTQGISSVLLAMPQINRKHRNRILNQIRDVPVSVRTLPSVSDLAQGKVSISDVHELFVDDLLGRETVSPNEILLAKSVSQKTVMVTGAGGSIGSELCRQIAQLSPERVLLAEQSEFALYKIHQELEIKNPNVTLIPLLANVQEENRLREIMETWRPQTVYHAAAYKHVPLVEHNLAEGIKNNVMGTLNVARAAISANVSNFVLVSTDKAVRPTNMMGASKRLAEIILQAISAENSLVNFSMVRFGNVLDSSGSVVPKFRQQIKNGGPVTITHPEITRFFMTLQEAAQLVIQSGAMAKGGDVFVLDMGEPVKIMELACRMIELSGLKIKNQQNPNGDIEIKITGLRPGEKLYEELLVSDDPEPTSHSRIMRAREQFIPWKVLEKELVSLNTALNANEINVIRDLFMRLIPDFRPEKEIVDWVYMKQMENVSHG